MVEGGPTFEEFADKNPVTFVTYNYDRLVEYKLIGALQAHYSKPVDECQKVLDKIRVLHLHGSLGTLYGGQSDVPYGCVTTDGESFTEAKCVHIQTSAQSIHIVDEANPSRPEFSAARIALKEAHRIFFLGFSFGRTNVDRLGLEHLNKSAEIRFTSYEMTAGEYDLYIQQPFQRFQLAATNGARRGGSEKWDCLTQLRQDVNVLLKRYD